MLRVTLSGSDVSFFTKAGEELIDSAALALNVQTNDANWYEIYLSAENKREGDEYAHLINSKPAVTATIAPVEPNKTLPDFGTNTWGYAIGKNLDKNTATYNPIPANTKAVKWAAATNGTADDQYNLAFGTKVAPDIPAGQYTNQVNISVIASNTPSEHTLTINYQKEDGTQAAPAYVGTFSLRQSYSINSPDVPGYSLVDPAQATISGIMDEADVTVTVLYKRMAFGGITEMQQMTNEICSSVNEGDTITLEDVRDDNTYEIAKLKDGKCWMAQNLNLKLTAGQTLTSDTSDVESRGFTMSENTFTKMPGMPGADGVGNGWYSWNTGNGWGTYYTWWSATTDGGGLGDRPYSVCPKGWRLPSKVEYEALINAYGGANGSGEVGATLRNSPGKFGASGIVRYVGSWWMGWVGQWGGWWSRTLSSSDSSGVYWHMFISGGSAGVESYETNNSNSNEYIRKQALPIRCIAR